MIVISGGMPKSGSAWVFNMMNDLMVEAGYADVHAIRKSYHLDDVLQYDNCLLRPKLTRPQILRLLVPHFLGKRFVVKAHTFPQSGIMRLMNRGIVRAAYVYRDPRDVALSAMDNGKKLRAEGVSDHIFARMETLDQAIEVVSKYWLPDSARWLKRKDVLALRYEDVRQDTPNALQQLVKFMGLNVTPAQLESVRAKYDSSALDANMTHLLHLNKARVERFREVMTPVQQRQCAAVFGPHLVQMGYPIN